MGIGGPIAAGRTAGQALVSQAQERVFLSQLSLERFQFCLMTLQGLFSSDAIVIGALALVEVHKTPAQDTSKCLQLDLT